ncbi:MAG: ABC transporter substrate-binding protein [Nitriliruptoraceae bacterium]
MDRDEAVTPEGTIRVGTSGEPPHLDPHRSTDTLVLLITGHVYETLFTSDARHRPVPLLAAEHHVSDDDLVHTITLRPGIRFHDGTPLTATDVIASLERWGQLSGLGAALLDAVEALSAPDPLTVRLQLHHPYGTIPQSLTRQLQAATIHPAHVLDRSDATSLAAPIGTGPYRVDGWEPGRQIRLERAETYRPPPGPADGYAGYRPRHAAALEFIPLPDEAARVAALRAGDVHLLETVSPDQLPVLERDPDITARLEAADVWLNLVLNRRAPALEPLGVRQAIQRALDHDAILQAAVGTGAYELDPDLLPGAALWSSEAGSEHYHPRDPEGARALLAEADALGTRLRLLTTLELPVEHNASLVIAQQLREVGFTVEVEVVDGATLSSWRSDESRYELYVASASFRPDPIMRNLTAQAGGWWEDPEKEALLDQLRAVDDLPSRQELWAAVQQRFHEDVPRIKIGDIRRVVAHRSELRGLQDTDLQPDLSTVWLSR